MLLIPGSRVTKTLRILPVDLVARHLAKHANIVEEHLLQIKLKAIEKEEKVALRELKREKISLEEELQKQEQEYFSCERVFSEETLLSVTDSFKRRKPIGPPPTKGRLPMKRLLHLKELLRAMPSEEKIRTKRGKVTRRRSEGDVSTATSLIGGASVGDRLWSASPEETRRNRTQSAQPLRSNLTQTKGDTTQRARSAVQRNMSGTDKRIKSPLVKELKLKRNQVEVGEEKCPVSKVTRTVRQAWADELVESSGSAEPIKVVSELEKKARTKRPQSSPAPTTIATQRQQRATALNRGKTRRASTAVDKKHRLKTEKVREIESKLQQDKEPVVKITIDVPAPSFEELEERAVSAAAQIELSIREEKEKDSLSPDSDYKSLFSEAHCIVSRSFTNPDIEYQRSVTIVGEHIPRTTKEDESKLEASEGVEREQSKQNVRLRQKAEETLQNEEECNQERSLNKTRLINNAKRKPVMVEPTMVLEAGGRRFSRRTTMFTVSPRRLSIRRESLKPNKHPGECVRHHHHHYQEQKEPHKKHKVSVFRRKSLPQELYGEQVMIELDLRKKVMGFLESSEGEEVVTTELEEQE